VINNFEDHCKGAVAGAAQNILNIGFVDISESGPMESIAYSFQPDLPVFWSRIILL